MSSASFGAMNAAIGVRHSAEMGRYAIAAQPLRAGQVLFEEVAFAVGPKPHTPVVCLGCCRPLADDERCSLCGWPLCGDDCESAHLHRQAECAVFSGKALRFYGAAAGAVCMQLDCITPLRLLLARDADPERWRREVEPMECHDEARRQRNDTWQADQVNIVGYLHGPCGLRQRFPADLIQRACGLLEVNSFEGRTSAGFLVRCIFPCTAVMAHACVPNTMHTIHPGAASFRIQVRATVDIGAGELLAASYTYTSSGTAERQEHLRAGKFFTCHCARCLDPSELGTDFSSLRCRKCHRPDGMIMSTNPLDAAADWRCSRCSFVTAGSAVVQAIGVVQNELDAIESLPLGVERLRRSETFLNKYRALLAEDHYLMTAIRHSLISMYGRVAGYTLAEMDADQLEYKIRLCRRVLRILDAVHPGLSRARALMLYELHAPLVASARRLNDANGLRQSLREAADMLLVCETVLGWEAPNSAVAAVARMARNGRNELLEECCAAR